MDQEFDERMYHLTHNKSLNSEGRDITFNLIDSKIKTKLEFQYLLEYPDSFCKHALVRLWQKSSRDEQILYENWLDEIFDGKKITSACDLE